MGARERLRSYWDAPPLPIGSPGFALPDLTGLMWQAIGEDGHDNWIISPEGFDWQSKLHITISDGKTGNVVVLGNESIVHGEIRLLGNNNLGVFGGSNPYHFNVAAYFWGNSGFMFFGSKSTSNSVTIWAHGDGTKILIGEDAMIADRVLIRTSDDHSIIDLETGEHINFPRSVQIDPHVWLCPEVHVLKGVRVGYGSIIGDRSVVTGEIARCVLAAGVPARPIKTRVSWDRPLFPRPDVYRDILAFASVMPYRDSL